jgi:hypothetical protein
MQEGAGAVEDVKVGEEQLSAQTSPTGRSGDIEHEHGRDDDQDQPRIEFDASPREQRRERIQSNAITLHDTRSTRALVDETHA